MRSTVLEPVHRPSAGVALYSSLERMCQVASKLPQDLQALYQAHFVAGKDPQEVCVELGLTEEEFERLRTTLLRSIRAGVSASLADAPAAQNKSS